MLSCASSFPMDETAQAAILDPETLYQKDDEGTVWESPHIFLVPTRVSMEVNNHR